MAASDQALQTAAESEEFQRWIPYFAGTCSGGHLIDKCQTKGAVRSGPSHSHLHPHEHLRRWHGRLHIITRDYAALPWQHDLHDGCVSLSGN